MNHLTLLSSYLKKIHRKFTFDVIDRMEAKGFLDLRPSFIEILLVVMSSSNELGPTIKEIGEACGLKKQTMTTHINELVKRGYILKTKNPSDKREQNITLTNYGLKFQLSVNQVVGILEDQYSENIGIIEIQKLEKSLENFYLKIKSN